mgnify:CR=1 FL=1
MRTIVYADNAATTKVSAAAFEAMLPYLTKEYGNPSSAHSLGRTARRAIERARVQVAQAIGALPEELYFTSGGTESDNWAIQSAVESRQENGRHIITSAIEHASVRNTLKDLKQKGYEVTHLRADADGQLSLEELRGAIRGDTVLITIMTANNEIGTILPVSAIGAIAREHRILFHTDAVQAVGHIPVDVGDMKVDMLSLSGHKCGAAKGVGALYMKKGLRLPALLRGGGQERAGRSGTENTAGIVSLSAALEEALPRLSSHRVAAMRDRLIDGLLNIPGTWLTGSPVNRLPGIASFVVDGVDGESMLLMLDRCGICASAGSACSSGALDPSQVLLAIGLSRERAYGALRLSLGPENTEDDIDYILEQLPEIVAKLRNRSSWRGEGTA